MLVNAPDLIDTPVLSLQTGVVLAKLKAAIINPHNLTIIAYEVAGEKLDYNPSFLRIADVREVSPIGFIIDSSEEFVILDDIIKQKNLFELQFSLENKLVLNENRQKIGKVLSYNLELDGFAIQQLVVKRPLLKSFNDGELIVHRSQVVEITDHAIVIKEKSETKSRAITSKTYANPFRQAPQAEAMQSDQD